MKLLQELLTEPFKWEPEHIGSGWLGAKFKDSKGNNVKVHCSLEPVGEETLMLITFMNEMSQGITGTGDQFRIFATVIAIITTWVAKKQPGFIAFAADKDEKSRVRLYDKLVEKYRGDFVKIKSSDDVKDEALRNDLKQWMIDSHDPYYATTLLAQESLVK